jgi:hypothetical protein
MVPLDANCCMIEALYNSHCEATESAPQCHRISKLIPGLFGRMSVEMGNVNFLDRSGVSTSF